MGCAGFRRDGVAAGGIRPPAGVALNPRRFHLPEVLSQKVLFLIHVRREDEIQRSDGHFQQLAGWCHNPSDGEIMGFAVIVFRFNGERELDTIAVE